MRSYDITLTINMRAVVPEDFTQAMRAAGKDPALVTPFLEHIMAQHPIDDDEFTLAVIKNGLRIESRKSILELFAKSGIGCTISPATARGNSRKPEVPGAVAVLATEIEPALQEGVPPNN